MLDLIHDIELALDNGNIRCALGMALTLPDICGIVEFPECNKVEKRYVGWCDSYLFNQGFFPTRVIDVDNPTKKGEPSRAITGDMCYKLRCAYLHSGNLELNQREYDDPLLFEEFSTKIKETIAEYDKSRDEDKYLATMEAMADDFNNGRLTRDYPASIANDSDTKAFYGSIITLVRTKTDINVTDELEEVIATNSRKIRQTISEIAKRDWKHNEVVHKQMHRALDDCLFDMFDEIGYTIDKTNIDVLDLIIDEIMKVAVARY